MSVGKNIKKYRKSKNLTQKQLAQKIGVIPVTITRYENNKREPNIDTLNEIAKALDVPVYELIGESLRNPESFNDMDLSLVPTNKLIEELNKRNDFIIKLESKNYKSSE
ncbi:hypothetical protein BS101_18390 [Clostridium kluyveri]|uniref:HTH cro/C1-type domain-containing protein n=1 Tax=Clostridium kluyveri TaxID=1534 RepID=A0A1L5FEA9_CLOKL|nr:hypothetical protein BS101_18390 [Clostridium kluyveri]